MKSRNAIIGQVRIKDNYVYKKYNNPQLIDLFEYLKSLNFYHIPEYTIDNNFLRYQYISDLAMNNDLKIKELIKVIASLHQKTVFSKEIKEDDINNLYHKYLDHIDYYLNYYKEFFDDHVKSEYLSPADYIIMRNYTFINSYLLKTKDVINEWYKIIIEEKRIKVSIIHNNLSLDHFILNDPNYLISWEHAKFECSLIDLVGLYQKYFYEYDFKALFTEYIANNPLDLQEKALLKLLLLINFSNIEEDDLLKQIKNNTLLVLYMNKTMELITIF